MAIIGAPKTKKVLLAELKCGSAMGYDTYFLAVLDFGFDLEEGFGVQDIRCVAFHRLRPKGRREVQELYFLF